MDSLFTKESSHLEASALGTSKTKEHTTPDMNCKDAKHSYLFSSDFVFVNADGNVMILSVPTLPFRGLSDGNKLSVNSSKQDTCHVQSSSGIFKEENVQEKATMGLLNSKSKCTKSNNLLVSSPTYSACQQESMLDDVENGFQCPKRLGNLFRETDGAVQMPAKDHTVPVLLDEECSDDYEDTELSPRLTNLIRSGVVPESPVHDCGQYFSFNAIVVSILLSLSSLFEGVVI